MRDDELRDWSVEQKMVCLTCTVAIPDDEQIAAKHWRHLIIIPDVFVWPTDD